MFETHNQKKITALAFSANAMAYHFENIQEMLNTRKTLLKRCNTSSASFNLKCVIFL